MGLSFSEIQKNVSSIANRPSYTKDVLFELMVAYGRSAASITKLRNGVNNMADDKATEIIQRGVVYFKEVRPRSVLYTVAEELKQSPLTARYNPRYLIVTDYDGVVAVDTKKSNTTLDIKLRDIDRHVDFFYGWTGDEIQDEKTEAIADRRAADKMKDLYAEIEKINRAKFTEEGGNFRHDLNVFFTRLLFCFFAEDTGVFSREEKGIFTNAIKDFTQLDGSDLDTFLKTLFEALDSESKDEYGSPFSKFPYVNGSLFDSNKRVIVIPKFNAQARKLILDCGNLSWAEINPDIFGSMFQGIVDEDHRGTHGMHYTSVPNIMKTIEPLFLDELREEFDKNFNNPNRLKKLLQRISKIKVLDPACGSGNFLIIAYKELRKLEHAIIENLLADKMPVKLSSVISLDNFYGIEIDDFAHEIAVLSLYIAKHQMNVIFEEQFGKEIKLIPLKDKANIVLGNAARLDWQRVCPNNPHKMNPGALEQSSLIEFEDSQIELLDKSKIEQIYYDEIYLIGNPPYLGAKLQDRHQKNDLDFLFQHMKYPKNLDYISIWFIKGAEYIAKTKAQLAFVSTNSICQGDHVSLLFPYISKFELEIGFAYTSFKWENSARKNAGVSCVVINLRNPSNKEKYLFSNGIKTKVDNINFYLKPNDREVIIERRNRPISDIPPMVFGSMPRDGGFLILDRKEREELLSSNPSAKKFVKKYLGSAEFIRGIERYCIWIEKADLAEAREIPQINKRINSVHEMRLNSKASSTRDYADRSYRFVQISYKATKSIIIPSVSSDRREYIPMGLLDENTVVSNLAFAIYDASPVVFGLVSSKMHMVWTSAVSGKLGTGFRYSNSIVYNNFPVPQINESDRVTIMSKARNVIFARENHSEKTMAELYDPEKMPEDLRIAHHDLDLAVDRLYRNRPYSNDEERLSDLFALYEKMTSDERKNNE